ncbi:T9SS type A sorting domain-containing protein [Tamlana sp. 2_MG-2023]|uniref:T9SS type A sorting domain-containing protein n=1 Tax=unclassified Tamlana TaxID=2614803 RepID=UPI0026E258A9|nr:MULTISPECIES: T9SS type A sorting domain-containing protein [unclassified Tamlana]MDO6759669.1 T9SS type A sorting domain-containing protein [Tamlana sp. 2_MG-2023]MDO6791292.1 T9SS type A sorting domain-containing protein [Tamlana sp. 1_MG-2023]
MKQHISLTLVLFTVLTFSQNKELLNPNFSEYEFDPQEKIEHSRKLDQDKVYQKLQQEKSVNLKTNATILLDSTVGFSYNSPIDSIRSFKTIYRYDKNDNTTERMGYQWDTTKNTWIERNKREITYDDKNNLTSDLNYNWNSSITDWEISSKNEYKYDANENLIYESLLFWDTNLNKWIIGFKQDNNYNEDNNLISKEWSDWDDTKNDWALSSKDEFEYDSNQNQILGTFYNWNSSTNNWSIEQKTEYNYDQNNNLIEELQYNWELTYWDPNSKTEYSYAGTDNLILKTAYIYSNTTGAWKYRSKNEFDFNQNGKIILLAFYTWEDHLNDWRKDYKTTVSYDANNNNNRSVQYVQVKDSGSNSWINSSKSTYLYDNNYNEITSNYSWNTTIQDFELTGKIFYYYEEDNSLNTEGISLPKLAFYPNPTTDYIHINVADSFSEMNIKLFDMAGRKVYNHDIHNSKTIDLTEVKPGQYVYKIIIDNKVYQGKLIKR